MALTNYMRQAAVLDVLSSGYGFGLTLRPVAYGPATALLFGVEAAASRAWLAIPFRPARVGVADDDVREAAAALSGHRVTDAGERLSS